MATSLNVNSFTTDLLKDTGFHDWLNFWLNQQRYSSDSGTFMYEYPKNGKYESLELPFPMMILEMLVTEEFRMILEHLGCKTFDDFDRLVKRRGPQFEVATEPVNLVVRAVDGSVYLRQYLISEESIDKLKRLMEKGHQYRSHQEPTAR